MAQNTVNKIGKYEVVDVLGKGGMGVVYRAIDNRIGRLVAIKMMTTGFAEKPDLLRRFYREAQSTGTLQHPNIVIVYDLGDQEGNPYLVMEFLEGEPLEKMIVDRRELSMVRKLDYIIQACNGLNYAHQRGIVHRDIKPANLMILRDGNVKIVDFGIARIGDQSLTRTGQVVGTITYMSPEQINAQVVDGRSDIFSTGVVLYELLTYSLPFGGKDPKSTLLKIIHEPPPPLKNFLPVYPPELEEVLHKALAKDREERYATAEDFAFALSCVQESLKKHTVSEYVDKAKVAIEKSELLRAKELLQEALKVDTQHGLAKELMHEVQQSMQRQQRGEQIRQLRARAEEALAQKLYEDAVSYVEQALALDKTNTELLNLRDLLRETEANAKLEDALRRAESARQSGALELAQKAVEEALSIDSENSQAVTAAFAIGKEISEKSKQKQVQGFLEEARRNISSRKFTAAFEVLKKAEAIDASPEVYALLNLAASGRQQESRRKELESIINEIEGALNRDDYQSAGDKADEALQKFANDPGLLKLKALADKQREASEKKRFLEEQMAAARKLLDAGKASEALAALEKASTKAPGESRLESLLAIVRDSVEREETERRKSEYIQQAKDAIRKKDYASAVKVLEKAQTEIESSDEINDLLQFARDEATTQAQRKKIDAAAEEAQRLISEEEYERAVAVLEATMKKTPDEELRVVLTEARRHVEKKHKHEVPLAADTSASGLAGSAAPVAPPVPKAAPVTSALASRLRMTPPPEPPVTRELTGPISPLPPATPERPRSAAPARGFEVPRTTPAPSFGKGPIFGDAEQAKKESAGGMQKVLIAAIAAVVVVAAVGGGYLLGRKSESAPSSPAKTSSPSVNQPAATTSPADNNAKSSAPTATGPFKTASEPSKMAATNRGNKPSPTTPANPSSKTKTTAPAAAAAPAAATPAPANSTVVSREAAATPPAPEHQVEAPALPIAAVPTTMPALPDRPKTTPVVVAAPQTSEFVPSVLIQKVLPVLPEMVRRLHIEGSVVLSVKIGKDGKVTDVKVVSGPAMLSDSAVTAVKQWRYKPAMLNGQPTESTHEIIIKFSAQ